MSKTDMTYIEELARFTADLSIEALPPEVVLRARQILLDSSGAIVAGLREAEFQNIRPGLMRQGSGPALIALLLGSAGVAIELDEGCAASRGHPGIHVVPAILAEAFAGGHDLAAILVALVAGYETAARLGRATTFRAGIHPHGTWGVCGAAVATGKLRGFDAKALAMAIKISAALPIATNYEAVHQGTTVRHLWSGLGNFNGVVAADLAASGFTGPVDMPARVFGETLGTAFDRDSVGRDLGRHFLMLGNYFKTYACCRHAHASVDAMRAILDREPVEVAAIAAIRVGTYGRAVDATGRPGMPETTLGAKFSIPYILSAYLRRGHLEHESFERPTLTDPTVAALSGRVVVEEEPAFTAMLPATRAARVTIDLRDGRSLVGEAEGSRGDPHDALTSDEVVAKFLGLATPSLGRDQAKRIAETVMLATDGLYEVSWLTRLLDAPVQASSARRAGNGPG